MKSFKTVPNEILYWAALFQLSWVFALWPDGRASSIAALLVFFLWLLAVIRVFMLSYRLKAWFETNLPGPLDDARVGSLAVSWNHSRLLRLAGSHEARMPTRIRMTFNGIRAWRRVMVVMLVAAPVISLASYALMRRT